MPAARPHVVVVDDDASILTLLAASLKAGLGAEVSTFDSGEAALASWSSGRPASMLMTDFSMPGINGLQLARRVRALDPTLPIVMLSAVDLPIEAPGIVTKCLTKPCPPRVLLPTLRTLLGLAEPPPKPAASPPSAGTLANVTLRYKTHLATVLGELPLLLANARTPEGERALRDRLHQLAGTAGSFGFKDVTEAALAVRSAVINRQSLDGPAEALKFALAAASKS